MSTAMDVVQLSRLQFGLTAMYHFLFVPLTLGLSILLGIMESVLCHDRQGGLAPGDQILGRFVRHQFRQWASPRVSPWNSSLG